MAPGAAGAMALRLEPAWSEALKCNDSYGERHVVRWNGGQGPDCGPLEALGWPLHSVIIAVRSHRRFL